MVQSREDIPFVAVTKLKRGLRYYVLRAKRGEVLIITKRGKPIMILQLLAAHKRLLDELRAVSAASAERGRGRKRTVIRTPFPSLEAVARELGVPKRRVSQLRK
ncbi:MAG: type II toxin-antitoxin system prevent-host-death family antitoxin [bacterium]|nr:type II toxin-antitoxin system prevent-host-death family antitoxin [bacterium]